MIWEIAYEPAGFALLGLRPNLQLIALDTSHTGETAWFCTLPAPMSCGVRAVGAGGAATAGEVLLWPKVRDGRNGS